jgi:hypothetical protein
MRRVMILSIVAAGLALSAVGTRLPCNRVGPDGQ